MVDYVCTYYSYRTVRSTCTLLHYAGHGNLPDRGGVGVDFVLSDLDPCYPNWSLFLSTKHEVVCRSVI